jgi:hypothetical protein
MNKGMQTAEAFKEFLRSKFGFDPCDLICSEQPIGDNECVPAVRFDTKQYPWGLFERFITELPAGVQVTVTQSVDVNAFVMTYKNNKGYTDEREHDMNFETQITTKFLFLLGA